MVMSTLAFGGWKLTTDAPVPHILAITSAMPRLRRPEPRCLSR